MNNIQKKHINILYFIAFFIIILGILFKSISEYTSIIGGIMLYIMLLIDYTRRYTKSIFGICMWLFIFPILLSLFVVLIISNYYKELNQDNFLIICLCTTIILLWLIASLILDKVKVKAAVSIDNAIVLTILSISFLTSMDSSITKMIYDKQFIEETIKIGISENSIVELGIKLLTLPYVLAGIWAAVVVDLRQAGVISLRSFFGYRNHSV